MDCVCWICRGGARRRCLMRPDETTRQTRWALLVPWASRAVGHAGTGLPRTPCVTVQNDCVDVQQGLQSRRPGRQKVRTGSDWSLDASCCCSDHSLNRHRRTQHSSDRTEQRRSHSTRRDDGALSPTTSYELVDACSTDGNAERPRGPAYEAATVSKFRTQQLQEQGSPGGTEPWLPRLGEIEGRLSERVSDSQLVQAD